MTAEKWFSIPMRRSDARLELFCFPHAGGGASVYFPWSKGLAGHPIEVAALKLPGRESRVKEPPCADLRTTVEAIGRALPLGERPFAFFGHSSGARVAFEVTRWLRDRGLKLPVHLFVSGATAPNVPRTHPPLYMIESEEVFLTEVSSRYGGIPKMVMEHDELRGLVAPALRADLSMHERYVYEDAAPLPVDITGYGGGQDRSVSEEGLERWREQTTRAFASRIFPGDHFYLHDQRDALLADLIARLQNVI
jgi:medium-chain acyl-[acyl-carrier-protein] hydrolase